MAGRAPAQGKSETGKVLVIDREFTKPGRAGSLHEATEAAYVRAGLMNKANVHYTALTSLSGQDRALFMIPYASMAAMEAEHNAVPAAAKAAMDKAMVADGDLLSEAGTSIWTRRDDLSTNVDGPPTGMRYLEITEFRVKPGHEHDFDQLAKMYVELSKKMPEMHWTAYEAAYGMFDGPTFLVLSAMKSAAEADAEFAMGPKIEQAMGEDGLKKMAALEDACVKSEMTNLFEVNPKMSSPTEAQLKAEPDFWRPKAAVTAARKPVAAKSTASGQ